VLPHSIATFVSPVVLFTCELFLKKYLKFKFNIFGLHQLEEEEEKQL
jgi:hypothetical protein